MIANFDETKRQLEELSSIINSFKSEAVQLKIIELVLGGGHDSALPESPPQDQKQKPTRKRKRKSSGTSGSSKSESGSTTQRSSSSRKGGPAMLKQLIEADFFTTAKTIGDIVQHCETNMASKYKQSDFSGALGRAVRNQQLKRTKNSNNTYEYVNA